MIRLSSLEDLGNITLLCTDKTGTLTEGKMSIQKIVADDPLRLQQFAAATVESPDAAGGTSQNSYDAAFRPVGAILTKKYHVPYNY